MAFTGIGKLIKDLVTGTPADTDYFAFGNTDLKKVSFPNLKKALGIDALNSALLNKINVYTARIPSNPTNTKSIPVHTESWTPVGDVSIPPNSLGILIASGGTDAILIMLSHDLELFICFRSGESWTGRKI